MKGMQPSVQYIMAAQVSGNQIFTLAIKTTKNYRIDCRTPFTIFGLTSK